MGNSSSSYSTNDKKVIQALIGRVGGVPIWPPIQTVDLLDVVVVKKDGRVDVLQNQCKATNLEGLDDDDRKKLEALKAEPSIQYPPSYTISSGSGANNRANLNLIEGIMKLGGKFNHNKDSTVTIKNPTVTQFATNDGSKSALTTLEQVLKDNAKMPGMYNRYNKKVFIVTEVTKAEDYTVSSSNNNSIGADATVEGKGGEVQVETSHEAKFNADGPVVISFKALRFDVSKDGILGNPKPISETYHRDVGNNQNDEDMEDTYKTWVGDEEDEEVRGVRVTGKKMALLIGNNGYLHVPKLRGCHKDVDTFEKYFEKRGIKCDVNKDLNYKDTLKKMNEYVEKLKEGDLFIFHYSGHGSTRKATQESNGGFLAYEETMCPIDTNHEQGINRDISRDVVQAWLGQLEKQGVKVFVIFDSCHSGGLIRIVDDDPLEKDCKSDDRDISQGHIALLPDYTWLAQVRENNYVNAALTNVASLSACKHYESAKEHWNEEMNEVDGGALSLALKKVLDLNEGKNLSFQQIMENVAKYIIGDLKVQNQQPDVSGNIDTVAFCFDNVTKVSPHPYNLAGVVKHNGQKMKMEFMSAYMLPLVTVGSQYVLYDMSDADMTKELATVEICKHSKINNHAIVRIVGDHDPVLNTKEPADFLRAVEIKHIPGESKHYTKVFIEAENNYGSEQLYKLKDILKDLKKDMYENRRKYPVKKLPPTSFITVCENEDDCNIKVSLDEEFDASVVDKNGNLVLPKVHWRSYKDVRLIASYIASYAHWSMLHNLSYDPKRSITADKGLTIDGNSFKIKMYCRDNDNDKELKREITPTRVSNEGYVFHINWDEFEDGTEAFKFSIDGDNKERCHVLLAMLGLDYAITENKDDHLILEQGSNNSNLLLGKKKNRVLVVNEEIIKDTGKGKWCRPYFEYRVFICIGNMIFKVKEGDPNLYDGLYGVASEGIQKAYKYDELEKLDEPKRGEKSSRYGAESPWGCIPIKIYVQDMPE